MAESLWDRVKGWIADNHAIARIETGMRENAAGIHLDAADTSYARYLRETENGGDRFAAWEGHEQRTGQGLGQPVGGELGAAEARVQHHLEMELQRTGQMGKPHGERQVNEGLWNSSERVIADVSGGMSLDNAWLRHTIRATGTDWEHTLDPGPDKPTEPVRAAEDSALHRGTAAVSQGDRDAARAAAPTPEHAAQMTGREMEKTNERGLER